MGREGKAGNEAFTLIELVMVILLIGILAAVVLPKFVNLTGSANKAASQGVVGSLGEGVTSQMSKDLVNNDLSSYIAVTGFTKTGAGTIIFEPTLPAATAAGTNPYANPFLNLPNYTTPASGTLGTGTSYNIVTKAPTVPVVAGTDNGNSWWLDYANGTKIAGPGNATTPVSAAFTCDNGNTTGPASTVDVPVGEYTEQIANVDYIYSNGSTEDSYVYYIVVSGNNNIEGLYMVPCQ